MPVNEPSGEKFVSLVFEINTEYHPPPPLNSIANALFLRRQETASPKGKASIWLALTFDERWRTLVPIQFKEHGFVQIGPMDWDDAERALEGIKGLLDQLGLEYTEQTTSDD